MVVAYLPPSTTSYEIVGLEVNTQYRAEVRHVIGQHRSTGDTEDFTTDATGGSADDLARLEIVTAT